MRTIWRPQVRADVVEISDYIARSSLRAARRFRDAVKLTALKLLDHPTLGAPSEVESPKHHDLRCCPVKDFPNYLIFYRPMEDGIEVYSVVHGSRDLDAVFGEG